MGQPDEAAATEVQDVAAEVSDEEAGAAAAAETTDGDED